VFDEALDGHVQAADSFEPVSVVDRDNDGSHPALSGRIEVGARPDGFSLRIVLLVRFIVEVVVPHPQNRPVLARSVGHEWVEAVHVVPGVEIGLADDGRAPDDGFQERVQDLAASGLAHFLGADGRGRGIVEARAAVVFGFVQRAVCVAAELRFALRQVACGQVAEKTLVVPLHDDRMPRDVPELAVDAPGLSARDLLQAGRGLLEEGVAILERDVMRDAEVDAQQDEFYHHKRYERACQEAPVDEMLQLRGGCRRHSLPPWSVLPFQICSSFPAPRQNRDDVESLPMSISFFFAWNQES